MPLFVMSIELILMEKALLTVITPRTFLDRRTSFVAAKREILPKWKLTRVMDDVMITEMFRSNEGFETRLTLERSAGRGVFRRVLFQFVLSKGTDSVRTRAMRKRRLTEQRLVHIRLARI